LVAGRSKGVPVLTKREAQSLCEKRASDIEQSGRWGNGLGDPVSTRDHHNNEKREVRISPVGEVYIRVEKTRVLKAPYPLGKGDKVWRRKKGSLKSKLGNT